MSQSLRIALLQLAPISGDISYNRVQIRHGLAIAAGCSAEVAITPELAESGNEFYKSIHLTTLPCLTYPFLESLREVAYKYEMSIFLGRPEQGQATKEYYNGFTHIDHEGNIVAHYRKQILSQYDQEWATAGNQPVCTYVKGMPIGLIIGEDGDDEEIIRQYNTVSPKLFFLPTYGTEHQTSIDQYAISRRGVSFVRCSSLYRETTFFESASFCLSSRHGGYAFNTSCPQVIIVDYDKQDDIFRFVARYFL